MKMHGRRVMTAGLLIFMPLCAAMLHFSRGKPRPQVPPASAIREALMARVGPPGAAGPVYCRADRLCGSDVLPSFYRARDYRPAWIDDRLALDGAEAFLAALRLVSEDGLDPANYHLAALESLLKEVRETSEKDPGKLRPETLADLEMLLTDSFLLCGSQLVHGQVNAETVQSEWFIKGRVEDLAAVLEKGLAEKDVPAALESLRPKHPVYHGLKKALRDYGEVARGCAGLTFPAGPKLEKGARGPRVEALRSLLEALGDLQPAAGVDRDLFDDGLAAGVKAFQARNGLEADGAVGDGTGAALRVPQAERLAQIRANLERWRWITPELGGTYVLINAAAFRVSVIEAGREALSMKAIVGRTYRRTPEFSGKITLIEINPFWTVPPKLAREDVLPRIKKDPGYLAEKGIRVFRDWSEGAPEIDAAAVDWSKIEAGTLAFKFRQDPGPRNALGRIKFVFPNKFDVYMHDTPERELFSRAVRDFSSGCIRLEKPVDLAAYLLRDDPDWNREKIEGMMTDTTNRVIRLRKPVDVHLLYWTAWLGDDGRVQFREDIYRRDEALYAALRQNAAAPAE